MAKMATGDEKEKAVGFFNGSGFEKTATVPKILVVDDNLHDIAITKMALDEMKHDVVLDYTLRGTEALEHLRDQPELPTLILIDLNMPGLNGIQTLRQIRADERLKEIPVIVLTSSNLESDMKAACEAGADGYLEKGFSFDEFKDKLDANLKRFLYC